MQGQYNHGDACYRCRYPKEYALAAHVRHPGNVYLREADVLPAIDRWLTAIFAPHRLTQTIREMQAAQAPPATPEPAAPAQDTQGTLADCDARLARYQATLDAGGDPQTIAEWTRQVKAERAAALARDVSKPATSPAVGSLKTTSAPLSPPSATCATSSTTPGPPRKQPSTTSSTSRSPSSPEKQKSGPKSPSARRIM